MSTPEKVSARFFVHSILDEAKSAKEARPIYRDMECCEIKTPGDRNMVRVFPAHEVSHYDENPETGLHGPVTYAMRFNDLYKKFKANEAQTMAGTPLEELTFLAQGKRYELKALGIHTAEQLADLDGGALKATGMGGRELKEKAQAYLDAAQDSSKIVTMAAEIAKLKEQIANMGPDEAVNSASPFASMTDEEIKTWLQEATGARPRGNPNHATLVRMADEVNSDLASKKAQEAA